MRRSLVILGSLTLFFATFMNLFSFCEEEVELSISDCLSMALAGNLDIKIAKIDPLLKEGDIEIARSIYDAIIDGKLAYQDDQRTSANTIVGTKSIDVDYELGITTELPLTGTTIEIDYSNYRDWTDSAFATNNPLHTGELSLTLTQPVLNNFFGYVDKGSVKLSKIEAELAGLDTLDRIENTIADTEKAYWRLVAARKKLALRGELLEQAKVLYEIFEKHLKTGVAESTELYEVEANMRIRKTEFMTALNEHKTAGNNLKLYINETGEYTISPVDGFRLIGQKADLGGSLKDALSANREFKMKKRSLEGKKLTLKMKENSMWPEVDLVGTLAVNGVDRKFEKANKRLFTNKHGTYYGGIEFSVPLENRLARGELDKAQLEKEKAILELVKTEKELITDIDEKVRAVNLGLENSTRWARIRQIQYKKFKDEEKKLKYGRSNSKRIVDYQNDLNSAAIREYDAILDYYDALIDLENAKDMLLSRTGVIEK